MNRYSYRIEGNGDIYFFDETGEPVKVHRHYWPLINDVSGSMVNKCLTVESSTHFKHLAAKKYIRNFLKGKPITFFSNPWSKK